MGGALRLALQCPGRAHAGGCRGVTVGAPWGMGWLRGGFAGGGVGPGLRVACGGGGVYAHGRRGGVWEGVGGE